MVRCVEQDAHRFRQLIVPPLNLAPSFQWESNMLRLCQAFLRDESGATAIEYGLIAAGISVVIIAAVQGIGTKLNATFTSISSQL